MNKHNLDIIINEYIRRFDVLNEIDGHDEGYKWRAETCFKQHWKSNNETVVLLSNEKPMTTFSSQSIPKTDQRMFEVMRQPKHRSICLGESHSDVLLSIA